MERAQQYADAHPYVQVPIINFDRVEIHRKPRSSEVGTEFLYAPFFDRPAIRVRLVHRAGSNVYLQKYDDQTIIVGDPEFAYYWKLIPMTGAHAAPAPAPAPAPALAVSGNTGGTANTIEEVGNTGNTGGTKGGARMYRRSRKTRRRSQKSRRY